MSSEKPETGEHEPTEAKQKAARPRPRGFFARMRARARGITPVPVIIEAAMCMGWTCALIVGEKGMTQAVNARRAVEDGADESASRTSAANCQPVEPSLTAGSISPSVFQTPKPNVQTAISAVAGLGLGGERTFPYYLLPMQNVRVEGQKEQSIRIDPRIGEEEHTFQSSRSRGCVEKVLDSPMGSEDQYRLKIWLTKFMGYHPF